MAEDEAKFFEWSEKASEQINKESFERYKKAAEQGDVEAQYNLGLMYEFGDGVEEDFDQAVKWFEKAAERGHEGAQDALEQLKE